ncbi:MAG: GAF domain-containing protein [Chloroflexi bacterium]|nr:GAF domain-containing protein [Chloroflexota bacterium]
MPRPLLTAKSARARLRNLENQVANRTKELAALKAIAAVTSHPMRLPEMLTGALEKTLELTGLEAGGIYLLQAEAQLLTIGAAKGLSAQFITAINNLKVGEGFSGRVVQTGQPLTVPDVSADPRLTRLIVQEGGFHALVVIPLAARGKVLGSMFLMTRSYCDFSSQEIELLNSIGQQIGVAIENARLFDAEQRRAEQFRVISEVGRRITSILNVEQLLQEIVRLLKETFGYYLATIGLIEGEQLVFKAGVKTGWGESQFIPGSLKVGGQGITAWVAATGEPLLAADVSQEPRYVFWPDTAETRSELAVALKTKAGIIGVLNVESNQFNAFDQSDITVLQSLAHQAAIAIENARLYNQAQQAAVLEERQRLARDLHDSVSQALYGMTLYSQAAAGQLSAGCAERAADYLRELQDTAQEALAEMRLLIFELRPPILEEEGLVAALQSRLQAVEGRAGLKTEFQAEVEGRLPPRIEEGLYRIAQEVLNNAVKHARARNIAVHLRRQERTVTLAISDDGVGFDPATARKQGGLGLAAVEERAAELGGRLTLQSQPGEGTRVLVEVGL